MPKHGKSKLEKPKENLQIPSGDKKIEKKDRPDKEKIKTWEKEKEKKKEKLVQKNKKALHQVAEEAEKEKLDKKQPA